MSVTLETCRCCGGQDLLPYLDLGVQPLANAFHKGDRPLPRFPLGVQVCTNCWHSQLVTAIDPEVLFRTYLYVSGTTHTFRRHCDDLARDARALVQTARPAVLDIACNDGTLLESFRALGCDVQGVDPALSLRPVTESKGIPVETEFWSTAVASKLGRRFDLVTALNVLGHVTEPLAFLVAARSALAPGGRLIVEFPYGGETLARCEFDQIYHEHVSYFLVRSFATLAERARLRITNVVLTEIHGGSIRFVLESGVGPHAEVVSDLAVAEASHGLHAHELYEGFAERVDETGQALVRALATLRATGWRVVGYGASAKGSTLLNRFGVSLDYVVDDNPNKWDLLTPGQDVLVRPPSALAAEPERLAILVMAWNFLDEIRERVAALRGPLTDDVLVVHVPYVHSIEVAS